MSKIENFQTSLHRLKFDRETHVYELITDPEAFFLIRKIAKVNNTRITQHRSVTGLHWLWGGHFKLNQKNGDGRTIGGGGCTNGVISSILSVGTYRIEGSTQVALERQCRAVMLRRRMMWKSSWEIKVQVVGDPMLS